MSTDSHLQVGIDLGTSRSSISASTGARRVVESYVGWPVDMVARKVLKKDMLIGQDALENRPMLDLLLVEADSMEAVLEMAKTCPFVEMGTIEVAEMMKM